jgi:DNA polymerase/3'-5' exonuclease PolX
MNNEQIARRFNQMGSLMEVRGEDSFRVRSYRMAAEAIETWPIEMKVIESEQGLAGSAGDSRSRQSFGRQDRRAGSNRDL